MPPILFFVIMLAVGALLTFAGTKIKGKEKIGLISIGIIAALIALFGIFTSFL